MINNRIFIFNASSSSSRGLILPGRKINKTFYNSKPIFIAGSNIKSPIGLPPIRPVTIKTLEIKRNNSMGDIKKENYENLSFKLWKKEFDKSEKKMKKQKEIKSNSILKDLLKKKKLKKLKKSKHEKKSYSVTVNHYKKSDLDIEKQKNNEIIKGENIIENKEENKKLNEEDEISGQEIGNIVEYLKSLNFEKYNRDMEIREALELIKSKMNKDNEGKKKEDIKENNNDSTKNYNNENENEENNEENKKENNNNDYKEDNDLIIINDEKTQELNPIEDKEEENKKEEIEKYKLAEIISKHKMLKNVHSIKSIRKLLQRQGLDNPNLIDKSKIQIQNEKNE